MAWIPTRKRFSDRNDDGSDAHPIPLERAYVVLFCAETYKQTYERELGRTAAIGVSDLFR